MRQTFHQSGRNRVSAAGAGLISASQLQANITTAATDFLAQIARLRDAGAKRIMVVNLPDIGQTPLGKSTPTAPFSALSGLFNSTLQAGLTSLNVDIIPMNMFGLFNEVIASPTSFGFSNVTSPACTVASVLCTSATLVAPNAPQTFLFADGVHPTTAGHALIADYRRRGNRATSEDGNAALAGMPRGAPGGPRGQGSSRSTADRS